ncbi:MAG: PIN/TRAM domain-containing protein [Tepidisphaeraceae bacterium]
MPTALVSADDMILHLVRALFVLLMAAVGWVFLRQLNVLPFGDYTWLSMAVAVTIAVVIVCVDILAPRKKLVVFSGTFLGLIVGLSIAYALSYVVQMVVDQYLPLTDKEARAEVVRFLNLSVGVISCYFAISFILQTKDDFRFIIPYVEFSKQTKGARPTLVDSSVLIDGRISDIARTGIIENQLIIPQFILEELKLISDSADRMKRNRGRRGLDIARELQSNDRTEVIIYDSSARHDDPAHGADEKLMALAKDIGARVLTNDFNLNKVAQLRGVDVININDLANALKSAVLPGEVMSVRLIKPGDSPGQGVGYLEDGTMVVVEQGRPHVGEDVEFTVTNTRQTSAGKMIFGRLGADGAGPRPPRPLRPRAQNEVVD